MSVNFSGDIKPATADLDTTPKVEDAMPAAAAGNMTMMMVVPPAADLAIKQEQQDPPGSLIQEMMTVPSSTPEKKPSLLQQTPPHRGGSTSNGTSSSPWLPQQRTSSGLESFWCDLCQNVVSGVARAHHFGEQDHKHCKRVQFT